MTTQSLTSLTAWGTFLILAVGCASTQAPQADHVEAKTAISAAEAAGAQDVPEASLYLKMARDGVEEAEALMKEEDYQRAEEVLQRAWIDAKLAHSLTREAKIKKEAQEELERVESLQESNNQALRPQATQG